ncbi:MAG TPA: glycosyltransferase family 87 protein [Rhizomicrobium sp.]|nr:glycosyltransferase family 87 protein [Rhizomicrobium sp.]
MAVFLETFRNGAFVSRGRIAAWVGAILIAWLAALAYLAFTAHGLNDVFGRPLGTDFSDIYVAGQAALRGDAASAFDPAKQFAHERLLFGNATQFYGWHYPPFFLLIAAPLAALPYIPALIVWQAISFALYLGTMWLLLRASAAPQVVRDRIWLLLAAAFPAVFLNLTHGHNGFLTAALLGGGILMLDKRPLLAGVFFGLLVYKPQFGLMIPVALIAEGRWRAVIAAALTVGVTAIVTTAIFGTAPWAAFVQFLPYTRTVVLEQGGAGFYKIQSVFAWTRMWGGPVALAYALQASVTLIVGILLFRLWRSDVSPARKGAALCIASLLATPYCFDYDMMALAPALALLIADGIARGFRPYEKVMLAGLWLVPLLARPIASLAFVPVGVPVMLAAFLLIATRGASPAPRRAGLQAQ